MVAVSAAVSHILVGRQHAFPPVFVFPEIDIAVLCGILVNETLTVVMIGRPVMGVVDLLDAVVQGLVALAVAAAQQDHAQDAARLEEGQCLLEGNAFGYPLDGRRGVDGVIALTAEIMGDEIVMNQREVRPVAIFSPQDLCEVIAEFDGVEPAARIKNRVRGLSCARA